MARPSYPLTILEFQERFATEEACRAYLFASRWPEGFCCPACGGRDVGTETRRRLWICKACGRQTSLTAGTVMNDTRTPLRTWFWAAYLVATHHPGISAKQLQRQLGLRRYETAWLVLQKLRRAMVAPEREPLKREVEVDEFFLGGVEAGHKGRGPGAKKTLCGVAVEVRGQGSGRVRLSVLEDASGRSLGALVKTTTAVGAIVHTDGWKGYNGLRKAGYDISRAASAPASARSPPAPCPPRDLEPQGLASRHPPRRLTRAPAGLPRRVHLPPQPARHSHGRLPDAPGAGQHPRAHHLRPDHAAGRLTHLESTGYALKRFAGLPSRRPLKAAIEHSIPLADDFWPSDKAEMPTFLCASAARAREFEERTRDGRVAVSVGPLVE